MIKSNKIREYFCTHPEAEVSKVAAKFKTSKSMVYKLRKQVLDESDWATGISDLGAALTDLEIPEGARTTDVDSLLDDRGKDYGKFIEGAEIMQMLKRIVHNYGETRDTQLAFDQREALDMIMHKVGRIINGNPDKADSWRDIAGYATLVADRLEGNAR